MNTSSAIRLLTTGNNERGDLFTRLCKDLFFALGYDNLRCDVAKSGRELDLVGEHRFEPRQVIAECKAHREKMGGAELNKFYGALTRERSKSIQIEIEGYFVSLGGFTENAVDQESDTGRGQVILLDGKRIVEELENCKAIVSRTEAAERAGYCARQAGLTDAVLNGVELVGHQLGYLWVVFYERGKKQTHFALIHADGTPLDETLAAEVIKIDKICGGDLYTLHYLPPPISAPERQTLIASADARYRQWLAEECGYIYLDGLPADTDLSATRLRLERLFVPLKGSFLPKPDALPESDQSSPEVLSIGTLLERAPHLAIVAAPGGGKSTLLKRLAMAYAFEQRRAEISDNLPERDLLPLLLRCRELRDRAHRPILELLDDIPRFAEMNADECAAFSESIHLALQSGKALLLVDGLDEISEEGARQAFASHLRTFVAMFPQCAIVVTSREAGFRLVAGVVAGACKQAKLSSLDSEDVLDLCERWHIEVVGNSHKVRTEAKELGQSIWDNERIRQLAENPLLLTTLLVVKRWIGELPRGRAALYREAIRVLVRTWNVQGFAPLDEEETLAQLSYVACAMMEQGTQRIGQKALLKLLQNARRELEAELQFACISPQEFLDRIEYRSSLLMQTGHEVLDGMLQPVYEFRHLTFQEYLAARGYVEEQYAGRDLGRSLADLLQSHFDDERWHEVIVLAAVLAGRKAEDLMKRLLAGSKQLEELNLLKGQQETRNTHYINTLLHQCVRDEVQISGPTLRSVLLAVARSHRQIEADENWLGVILRGKFAAIIRETVEQEFLSNQEHFREYRSAFADLSFQSRISTQKPILSEELARALGIELHSEDYLAKLRASLVIMRLAYLEKYEMHDENQSPYYQRMYPGLQSMLDSNDLRSAVCSSWALAWIGDRRLLLDPPQPHLIVSLYRLWRELDSKEDSLFAAWALSKQQLLSRQTFDPEVWGDCDEFLKLMVTSDGSPLRIVDAGLVVSWYRGAPWNDVELGELLAERIGRADRKDTLAVQLLKGLGEPGHQVLKKLNIKS